MKMKQTHNSDERHFDSTRCHSPEVTTKTVSEANYKSSENKSLENIDSRNDELHHEVEYNHQAANNNNNNQQNNNINNKTNKTEHYRDYGHSQQGNNRNTSNTAQPPAIPQRFFMDTLLKHTAIALAIIVPLAAYSAFATSPSNTSKSSPFVSLEEKSDDKPEVNSQYKQNDRLANSDTRYINTLGVPVYDDDIFLASENLQQVDLSNTDSAIVDTDDAPISARN